MKNKITLHLRRIKQYGETTLGQLTILGTAKSWFVLEPGGPDSKTEGSDKRIVAGAYKMQSYSSLKYKNVYEVKGVPGRTNILLHAGNYHNDTLGCLMPGKTWGAEADKHFYVGSSKRALQEIISVINGSNQVVINITNDFEG